MAIPKRVQGNARPAVQAPVPDATRAQVRDRVQQDMRARLGVQQLPPQLTVAIDRKVNEALTALTDRNLSKEALRAAKEELRGNVNVAQNLQARLADALQGVQ